MQWITELFSPLRSRKELQKQCKEFRDFVKSHNCIGGWSGPGNAFFLFLTQCFSHFAANSNLRSTEKQVTFTLFYLDSFSVTEEYSYCSRSPCQNGGTCINARTSFICACRHPFTGDNCTVKLAGEDALAPGKKVHVSLDLLIVINKNILWNVYKCMFRPA